MVLQGAIDVNLISLFLSFEGGGLRLALSYSRSSWLHDLTDVFLFHLLLCSQILWNVKFVYGCCLFCRLGPIIHGLKIMDTQVC